MALSETANLLVSHPEQWIEDQGNVYVTQKLAMQVLMIYLTEGQTLGDAFGVEDKELVVLVGLFLLNRIMGGLSQVSMPREIEVRLKLNVFANKLATEARLEIQAED